MAENTALNTQITDEVEETSENPGGDAGNVSDIEDFHDPTPAAPVGGSPEAV